MKPGIDALLPEQDADIRVLGIDVLLRTGPSAFSIPSLSTMLANPIVALPAVVWSHEREIRDSAEGYGMRDVLDEGDVHEQKKELCVPLCEDDVHEQKEELRDLLDEDNVHGHNDELRDLLDDNDVHEQKDELRALLDKDDAHEHGEELRDPLDEDNVHERNDEVHDLLDEDAVREHKDVPRDKLDVRVLCGEDAHDQRAQPEGILVLRQRDVRYAAHVRRDETHVGGLDQKYSIPLAPSRPGQRHLRGARLRAHRPQRRSDGATAR